MFLLFARKLPARRKECKISLFIIIHYSLKNTVGHTNGKYKRIGRRAGKRTDGKRAGKTKSPAVENVFAPPPPIFLRIAKFLRGARFLRIAELSRALPQSRTHQLKPEGVFSRFNPPLNPRLDTRFFPLLRQYLACNFNPQHFPAAFHPKIDGHSKAAHTPQRRPSGKQIGPEPFRA